MGVDSGLGTFRGRNAGVWPPLEKLGMRHEEMSTPRHFDDDPFFAWAFWKFRHDAYRINENSRPHAGYGILKKW